MERGTPAGTSRLAYWTNTPSNRLSIESGPTALDVAVKRNGVRGAPSALTIGQRLGLHELNFYQE